MKKGRFIYDAKKNFTNNKTQLVSIKFEKINETKNVVRNYQNGDYLCEIIHQICRRKAG